MLFDWFKSKKKSKIPEFWAAYLVQVAEAVSLELPIQEVRFVAFDTETTGLDVKKDRILSIGAVRVYQQQIDLADTFECLVQQDYEPTGQAIPIHGILPKEQKECLTEQEALQVFIQYIGNSVLVGHHLRFDLAMMNKALRAICGQKLRNKGVDTARLAARLSPGPVPGIAGAYGLDQLCRQYNIPASDRHTAAGDAFITAVLFMKLVARLRNRGVRTLGDLLRRPVF